MLSLSECIQAQFDHAVSVNPDAVVCTLDPEGLLLTVSPSINVIHGYSQAEMVGRNFAEFFDSDDVTHLSLVIQDCLLTGESIEATRRVRHKSGLYRRMRGGARRLDDEITGRVFVLSIGRPY